MQYKEIFEDTYRGKKIFLTGHTGFKGSWLLVWLHQLGAIVKGYSLAPEENSLYTQINGDGLCTSVFADIRDRVLLHKEILSFQPDFVFHLAAQPLVRRSYDQPLYTFEVNVNGTAHVLEAVKELNNDCQVVIVTTDKVYENREQHYFYKEEDPLGGHDPYSASKAAAEILTASYRLSFFSKNAEKGIATARAGNVIGGGDWAADRIMPDIIKALNAGKPVVLRNPKSIRPWQHVLEPLSGYLLLGVRLSHDAKAFSSSWNFGPTENDTLTVEELVSKAIGYLRKGSYENAGSGEQPHEASLLMLNIEKAASQLGWKPKLDVDQAIEYTVGFYRDCAQNGSHPMMISQIEEYQQLK